MLEIDERAPRAPRLPRRQSALAQLAASGTLHVIVVCAVATMITVTPSTMAIPEHARPSRQEQLTHIVFLAPESPIGGGGGGGGGGNQRPEPIRRAQGVGSDPITLRTKKTPPALSPAAVETLPSILLDAKPMASGTFDQVGLPAGVMMSPSTGPGSGGGVGTGAGTGIGSGRGPGFGPGSGGGIGSGEYRPGGAVSEPRVITQVRPRYTPEAMRDKIQGTVVLEVVVTSNGTPARIRVVRSLPGGLDEEAIAAVSQWRFEPGRIGGTPVDVLVTVMLDFTLR